MSEKTWKTITKKPLRPSIETIRMTFGIGAWSLALDTETLCRRALTDANRSRPEPDIFREHYVRFSKALCSFVRSTFGKVFEIALKNQTVADPVDWTRLQLTFMLEDKLRLSGEECRIKDWIVYACDGYHVTKWPALEDEQIVKEKVPIRHFSSARRNLMRDSWLAPVWLRDYPYNPKTALDRESEDRSQKILEETSYLLVHTLRTDLKKVSDEMHNWRAVTPIDPGGLRETAISVASRQKPLRPLVRVRKVGMLEECRDALTQRQYRAMELKLEYALKNNAEIARHMGTSRQNVDKLLEKANLNMTNFQENSKAGLRMARR